MLITAKWGIFPQARPANICLPANSEDDPKLSSDAEEKIKNESVMSGGMGMIFGV